MKLTYNPYQQLATDYQSHNGAVNPGSTPNVAYAYANGSAHTIRLNTITYPNARVVTYGYGTTGGIDDLRDRVTTLSDSATTGTLVTYTRFGLDRTVVAAYGQPALQMTYVKLSGEPNGDGGDQYTGLDRFNRVVDSRWINSATADVNRFKYGYSRASNRLWRQNTLGSSSGFDEQYVYDGLYQLTSRKRGTLSGGVITGTPAEEEDFTFDPTGNWPTYVVKESGTMSLNQTRTHQFVNEIMAISGGITPIYDSNGNMTTMPQVDVWGTAQTLTYDAWNRPMTIVQGTTTVGTYAYDGLNRRVTKISIESGSSVTRHFYYSNQWQVLEERTGTNTTAERQYVWGVRYQDDLVLRDLFGEPRMYALADYFQPTALSDISGNIQERYAYKAFGDVSYYSAAFDSLTSSSYNWTYLYGTYQLDLESLLYQVRYRYYHSALGRWLSRDPYVDAQGNDAELTQGSNLYLYVNNNTVNIVDPSGLDNCSKSKCKASALKAHAQCIGYCAIGAVLAAGVCAFLSGGLAALACGGGFLAICSKGCDVIEDEANVIATSKAKEKRILLI